MVCGSSRSKLIRLRRARGRHLAHAEFAQHLLPDDRVLAEIALIQGEQVHTAGRVRSGMAAVAIDPPGPPHGLLIERGMSVSDLR